MTQPNYGNGFSLVWHWICSRWKSGYLCFSLWGYFILCVIVFGCMGIWFELFKAQTNNVCINIILSVLSSSWAIAGASSADFIYIEKDNYIRSIPIFIGILLGGFSLIVWCVSCLFLRGVAAAISIILAGAMWFIINAGKIRDVNSLDSVGGDVEKELTGKTTDVRM